MSELGLVIKMWSHASKYSTLQLMFLFIYLFVHALFNDAVSSSGYTVSSDRMKRE
jgi:hypothetical protein